MVEIESMYEIRLKLENARLKEELKALRRTSEKRFEELEDLIAGLQKQIDRLIQ